MDAKPMAERLALMLAEMRDALNDLENGAWVNNEVTPSVYEMIKHLSAAQKGLRTNWKTDKGSPTNIKDEEGVPMPRRSDPTGESAVGPASFDPMLEHLQSVSRSIASALGDVRVARGQMIAAAPRDEDPPEPGCRACAIAGVWNPVERAERCRWCYNFALVEGYDPPAELLKARAEGRKITQPMIEQSRPSREKRRKQQRPVVA